MTMTWRRRPAVDRDARVRTMIDRNRRAIEASRFLFADDVLSRAATLVAQAARTEHVDASLAVATTDKALRLLGLSAVEFTLDLQRVLGDAPLPQALSACLLHTDQPLDR